jgi:hypothetical protein
MRETADRDCTKWFNLRVHDSTPLSNKVLMMAIANILAAKTIEELAEPMPGECGGFAS